MTMIKRTLFFSLTAFVISLPITTIWIQSKNAGTDWQNQEFNEHNLLNNPTGNSLYRNHLSAYFYSLRQLLNDHEAFGPYT